MDRSIIVASDFVSQEWYTSLVDDCKAAITECEFNARWALVEGYHTVGRRILEETKNFERSKVYGQEIVRRVALSLGRPPRRVWEMVQFAKKYPDLELLPSGKDTSWHKVTHELLPTTEDEEAAGHPVTETEADHGLVFAMILNAIDERDAHWFGTKQCEAYHELLGIEPDPVAIDWMSHGCPTMQEMIKSRYKQALERAKSGGD